MTSRWPAALALFIGIGCGDNITVTDACEHCPSPAQLACEGRAERATCDVPGEGAGTCVQGSCLIAICGDSVVEPDEACDDGNTISGDGCNATCTSNERCGNGLIDPNEACDDGNTTSEDGCNSTCTSNETCGNGHVDPFEVCDDGNTSDGDGCDSDCRSD